MSISARVDGLRRLLHNARPVNAIAAGAVAVVLVGYAAGILRPKLEDLRRARKEIAELEDRRATRPAAVADGSFAQSERPQAAAEAVTRPAELVPAVSRLGRRSGLRVQAIKQTAGSGGSAERRLRVLAQGPFPAVVSFLEGIVAVVSHGQLEELTLRHSSTTNQIELESVLRVKVDEPVVATDGDDRRDGS